jgi:hypothetical protein
MLQIYLLDNVTADMFVTTLYLWIKMRQENLNTRIDDKHSLDIISTIPLNKSLIILLSVYLVPESR